MSKTPCIINLTPHPVVLIKESGEKTTFDPSGEVARVSENPVHVETKGGIPFYRVAYGEGINIPKEERGKLYIVSGLVRAAFPENESLISPIDFVRDDSGRIIGCKGFAIN